MQALQKCAQCKRSQRKLASTVCNHQNISHTVQPCFSGELEFGIWISNNTRKCEISQSSESSIFSVKPNFKLRISFLSMFKGHTSLKRHPRFKVSKFPLRRLRDELKLCGGDKGHYLKGPKTTKCGLKLSCIFGERCILEICTS